MRCLFFLLLSLITAGAGAAPQLEHEAYVWQRRWTPELVQAAVLMRTVFGGYRVLVGELGARGEVRVAVDWTALAQARRPVVLVLRIPGATPAIAVERAALLLADARTAAIAAGIVVAGIEIDHDCARSQLPAYAAQLRALRTRIDAPLAWSITALPDWLHSDAMPQLLAAVDASVLQVHAVEKPGGGLFDAAEALRWIRAYARLSPKPFRVALPAYATRVTQGDDGRILAIESDAATMPVFDARARELVVDPRRVAEVLARLRAAPPPGFAGVVWFRLPLASDRRAWVAATLRALVADQYVARPVRAERVRIGSGANFDVVLRNEQQVDALAPRTITVPAECSVGEGVAGYRFDAERARFEADAPPLLKPGASRTIGWVDCRGT